MVETTYLHIQFKNKNGGWSVNLPFVCDKCGVCCKIDDFLTAGPAKVSAVKNPQLYRQLQAFYEEIGKRWETNPEEYDQYITHTSCLFLKDKICSIYPYRPDGCRQFPNTPFGMLSTDCAALDRFKKQQATLCRGRAAKKAFHFTDTPVRGSKLTEKQYHACISKLLKIGITKDELALFAKFNGQES